MPPAPISYAHALYRLCDIGREANPPFLGRKQHAIAVICYLSPTGMADYNGS